MQSCSQSLQDSRWAWRWVGGSNRSRSRNKGVSLKLKFLEGLVITSTLAARHAE